MLENLFVISNGSNFKRVPISLDILDGATTVYFKNRFTVQQYKNGYNEAQESRIYFVQKYDKILTALQFLDFVKEHPEENFVIMDNDYSSALDLYAFSEATVRQVTIHIFNSMQGDGLFHKVAIIKNKYGECVWEEPENLIPTALSIRTDNRGYRREDKICHSFCLGKGGYNRETSYIRWINNEANSTSTYDILAKTLIIPNQTRVIFQYSSGDSYHFDVVLSELGLAEPKVRYGIDPTKVSRGWYETEYYHTGTDDTFPEGSDLSEETLDRVRAHMTHTLETQEGKLCSLNRDRYYYGGDNAQDILATRLLVISKPIPGHRRPTYHYMLGIKSAGAIDIVEVARGELQMNDMTPVNIYYLNALTGGFNRVSHRLFGALRNDIVNKCEIDKVTFTEWNEDKNSDNRELLKALANCGLDDFDLPKVKLLRKLPFGMLFIEQLIKGQYKTLAFQLAEKITTQADNWDYVCNSLTDILPGCNPEGRSLMETFAMNKPCFTFLMNDMNSQVNLLDTFLTKYRVIKTFVENGILTSNNSRLVEEYMLLFNRGRNRWMCGTGRTLDLCDHPEDIKSVYKMTNRLDGLFGKTTNGAYDANRRYEEICRAYFQFKDFGWSPEDNKIFIEFSLGTDLIKALQELSEREKAANTALGIYKAKIQEEQRKRIESRFSSREKALKRLETTETFCKGSKYCKNYVVIKPSQIYGEDVVASIEKEGRDMEHCVFRQYADSIANGTYTVMYLRYADSPEDSLITIGIADDGRINQTFAKYDHSISATQAAAIAEWAESKKGLVTFKNADGITVYPSGWNCSATLPDLPRPDKAWLAKLAGNNNADAETAEE